MNGVAIANAPCSYGAFEITVGVDPNVPPGSRLLQQVGEAGYAGIDLGPLGYLGTGTELRTRLEGSALALAGGYFEVPFSDPDLEDAVQRLDQLLDVFDTAAGGGRRPPPLPTLADAGSDSRRRFPGRAVDDRRLGWDTAGWKRFADSLARLAQRCRSRGYEPTFHPHTATYVEAPWEIERLLELSDVGLCLDTGHLLVGGGDPVQAARDWGSRINHVHIKDARRTVIEEIVRDQAPVVAIWERRAFCRLGTGDVPLDSVLHSLRDSGYQGWLVVEQDILPDPADLNGPVEDQRRNRQYLRDRGL
ncbi:MAG: TIM barrel protein [Gemmatimonadales bacterium]